MAQGYLVTLGNGTLDAGDVISGDLVTFGLDRELGTGEWTWSGNWANNGVYYSNVIDTGVFYLGVGGNVYFVPDNWFVDPIDTASAVIAPSYSSAAGDVDGTAGDDVIDGTYEDAEYDSVSASGDVVNAGAGNDTVATGAGDDTIYGGTGDDTIYAGSGDDTIEGGDGADVIHADNTPAVAQSEEMNWTDQGGNATALGTGFTQNTGTMNVEVTINDDGGLNLAEASTDAQYVDTGAGETFNTNSAIQIVGDPNGGDGVSPTCSITFDFSAVAGSGMSDEVENVNFRVNDIDEAGWDDNVTVLAYDADGNPVDVTFQLDGDDTMLDSDTIDGAGTDTSAQVGGSALITVAGPVSQIVIIYENAGDSTQALWVTDVHFDTIPDAAVGNDTVDGGLGNDIIYGYAGDDVIDGGAGDDTIDGGAGDDTIEGGTGDDSMAGAAGNDTFVVEDGFGTDDIVGGETGEMIGDVLDASGMTADTTLDLAAGDAADPEDGTLTDGTNTVTFSEIEEVFLGSGDDVVTGSDGDDAVTLGAGADRVDGGAGDDFISLGGDGLGGPDGDADVVVFSDGDGNDVIVDIDTPTDNGDGTWTGIDTLDVSDLTDAGGDPVSVHDVTVSSDGFGSAVLSFPNGESLTLVGVSSTDAADPMYLIALGIPGDGIVSGTAAGEVIDSSYNGDIHGDMVDSGDAILPGESGDDDIIEAGAGDDTIYGGAGDDEINAGAGDDTIHLEGTFGNDEIVGGETGETTGDEAGSVSDGSSTASFSEIEAITTGSGDDTIDASLATSPLTLDAGAGNDTITGGTGADTLEGGTGDDTFYAGEGDHVSGGENAGDADVLDLTGAGPSRVIYNEGDPESGTVEFLDGSGNITGTMTFDEIETVNFIPCFTPGTLIATPEGPRAVEDLAPGDRVLTRDNGVKLLEWVGQRLLNANHLAANPRLMPVRIKAGALGFGLPERDMMVSPQHKMLISDARAELLFGEHEVLVAAVHLVGLPGIDRIDVEEVIYIHVMFDAHEIIMAEGAWTESYQPGVHVLSDMDDEQREEILDIFPELRNTPDALVTARMPLKKREVVALFL